MIQRIQTLWLAIIVALSIASFFFPVAIFTFDVKAVHSGMVYGFMPEKAGADMTNIIQKSPAWTLIIFQSAILILTAISIFLYSNRQLQLKVIAFTFLLLVAYLIVLFLFKVDGLEKDITKLYSVPKTTYGLATYFPIGQILCFIFARNAIRKDEQLVRSSDHLR
jgi:hypothetical protein